jgi:ADP-ribose pyrophosphatase
MINAEYKNILRSTLYKRSNENDLYKIVSSPTAISKWRAGKIKELKKKHLPVSWADIGIILDDPYIVVLRDLVKFPDGHLGGYFRILNRADLEDGRGVAILAEMDKKYLLIHMFRHPTRSWSYEVPRGFGEPRVSAVDQAKSEISEEVGGEISELINLGPYHSNTGLEGNKVQLFYAKLISVGNPEKAEGIKSLIWVSLIELEEMIANEKILDGFTIATYTRAKLRGLLSSQ